VSLITGGKPTRHDDVKELGATHLLDGLDAQLDAPVADVDTTETCYEPPIPVRLRSLAERTDWIVVASQSPVDLEVSVLS
jgi:hypothetical protein